MSGVLPLTGIRVIEMSHMVMGPTCGMILAQLGAEVIKVEPPKGDKTRSLKGMGTAFFPLFNRGKRSLVLDITHEKDREILHKLLDTADVFLENFKDGLLARQGLAHELLLERHPALIIAGHKGFLSGPYQHRPALDEVVQMMSGLAMMTGTRARPLRVGSSINDIMGGMFGVIGILAALRERDRTARGKNIRIGLFENSLFSVAQHMVQYEMTGVASTPMPERTHAWPVYDIFDTSDGQKIFIAVVTDGHWKAFCETYSLAEFLNDDRLGTATDRIEARSWTIPKVAEKVRNYSMELLSAKLDSLSIPFAPINSPEDLFDDPHVQREGGLVHFEDSDGQTYRAPTLPLELDGEALGEGLHVPALGADTDEILKELGVAEK
ncbi:CaiB/BaiF CoA-transferase family protein [Sneathiella sp.]|uniref:CaiB/BaiF CoA transferase family protein n=1 Tax=Sneathiella sp. TaxID=1964365 RepID=UPI0026320D27|nr:CoA transferase [Sneathiella sp.]MDF2366223.1 CoA transferase [Sneathiella sp.]